MMKPILFNTEMVRAILDGRKFVTRRVVKPQYGMDTDGKKRAYATPVKWGNVFLFPWADRPNIKTHYSPPYRPGDILWVRETWCKYIADHVIDGVKYAYRADTSAESERFRKELGYKWHPSIHMPREAARIFLRVTDVRVERLQEIDGNGLRAEGFDIPCLPNEVDDQFNKYGAIFDLEQAKKSFSVLWDSTIKPADHDCYSWDANPWVWVIEFERCEKPQD